MKRVLTVILIAMLIAVMVAPVWATDDSLDETSGERTISTAEKEAKVAEALRKGLLVRDGWRGADIDHSSSHPLRYEERRNTGHAGS